ncbi:hypothetical protein TWF694_004526 [Orbilia ellipsospora]|uniref:AB hydrolase-1 domain-containing protein n=1 Tax=Orbilia ellipsospora TaxID=2528407 RepID=A0AAV9WWN9_9PEZI
MSEETPWKDPVQTFTLYGSNRTLAYAIYGTPLTTPPKAPCIFYMNGTPGCHLEALLYDRTATTLGATIISTDRPGFGRSAFQQNFSFKSWSDDILQLADHLEIDKFGVLGTSGGGPYVLACLNFIPRERLVGASVVSAIYPLSFGTKGMLWQTRLLLFIVSWSTFLGEILIDLTMGRMVRRNTVPELLKMMEKQSAGIPQPEVDKECMKLVEQDNDLIGAFLGSMKEALRESSRGAAWEFWLFAQDESKWGWDFGELDGGKLTIWHGGVDVNVPVGMADAAVERIGGGVRYQRMGGEGHISLVTRRQEEILKDLMGRF